MFAIIKKGSQQVYKIYNSVDGIFPDVDEAKKYAWQYTLENFGCFQGDDSYYIKDIEYTPGSDIWLWHHLLKKKIG